MADNEANVTRYAASYVVWQTVKKIWNHKSQEDILDCTSRLVKTAEQNDDPRTAEK